MRNGQINSLSEIDMERLSFEDIRWRYGVRHKALQLHISRIFDNPRWVNFIPFNREYRPEVLEHASLVTVINECCGKPGEVTQEQIDGACTGTVACPHCGRWSSFSIVEPKQAEEQGMEMI